MRELIRSAAAVMRGWLRPPACERCGEFDQFTDGLCFECLWAVSKL